MIRIIVNKIVKFIHILVVFILLFGVFLPSKYLIYYIFLWPAIYIHWYFNDNQCMLSEIEYNLDEKYLNNIKELDIYKYRSIFYLLKKCGVYFDNTDNFLNCVNSVALILWFISFVRCLVYYRKNISSIWNIIKNPLARRMINDK
jgi:hypothetical protein